MVSGGWQLELFIGDKQQEKPSRWRIKRKRDLVLSGLKAETSVTEEARKHGLTITAVETWKDRFLMDAENALRSKLRNGEASKDNETHRLKRKIGDVVVDIDILRDAQKPYLPTVPRTSDELKC